MVTRLEASKSKVQILSIFFVVFLVPTTVSDGVTSDEAKQLRDEVREMFYHALTGYMENAFPLDELRPLSCWGEDSLGGYALTLIDSLDTLALPGDRERFAASVEWIGKNLPFDINKAVSLFETTIRVLGGLLSAHLIASEYATGHCPGLTHAQKFGITYVTTADTQQNAPTNEREQTIVRSLLAMVVPDQNSNYLLLRNKKYHDGF